MRIALTALVFLSFTTAALADMQVSFEWGPTKKCFDSKSPPIKLSGVPAGTARLDIKMVDMDAMSFDHGGGKVDFKGQQSLPYGAFRYKGPLPTNASFVPLHSQSYRCEWQDNSDSKSIKRFSSIETKNALHRKAEGVIFTIMVKIPIGGPLKTLLDSLPRISTVILTSTKHKRPWTKDGFNTSWSRAKNKAGCEDLTFHDLGGTAVTRLAIAGCSTAQIASIAGHSLKDVESILDSHYLRKHHSGRASHRQARIIRSC